ncbi:MAG: MotA/TolQ/ExbB proton channel family protein [Candidatus Caldatribacteriaceae bacterium]
MQFFSIIAKGGYIMYPIVACSVIALAIFLERWYVLRHSREEVKKYLRLVRKALSRRDLQAVLEASQKFPMPASRIILAGLKKYFAGQPKEAKEAMEVRAMQELPSYERRLSTLVVIANISPLLGLLGTVTGMIKTFSVIAAIGVGKPTEMAGGISEALLTTAAGLSVAIPTVVMHHYLSRLAEHIIDDIERLSTEVLEVMETTHPVITLEGLPLPEEPKEDVPVPATKNEI